MDKTREGAGIVDEDEEEEDEELEEEEKEEGKEQEEEKEQKEEDEDEVEEDEEQKEGDPPRRSSWRMTKRLGPSCLSLAAAVFVPPPPPSWLRSRKSHAHAFLCTNTYYLKVHFCLCSSYVSKKFAGL